MGFGQDPGREIDFDGFARSPVPDAETGSAAKVFFIVTGSLCGLPVLILGAQIVGALGFKSALWAIALGCSLSASLGACSCYSGAISRKNFALLAEETFGTTGARLVKLAIALGLLGWFSVVVAVLGATTSAALAGTAGVTVAPAWLSMLVAGMVVALTLRGVRGLDLIGKTVALLLTILVVAALVITHPTLGVLEKAASKGTMPFGTAVSSVLGIYIVGIVIQPDYGRYVRNPLRAGVAAAAALGGTYPCILVTSAIPAVALGAPSLMAALIVLGFGIPAIALLMLGAWIDASVSLYSGSVSLTNQVKWFRLRWVILIGGLCGLLAGILGVQDHFIDFLSLLSVTLPSLAVTQSFEVLYARVGGDASTTMTARRIRWIPLAAWLGGVLVGRGEQIRWWAWTSVPALDSILFSLTFLVVARFLAGSHRLHQRALHMVGNAGEAWPRGVQSATHISREPLVSAPGRIASQGKE